MKQEDIKVSQSTLMIERANALESTRELLVKHFNLYIPESGSTSVKIACPWRVEHKDGGKDKAMRYYFDTDSAFCFRDHGVIDPVMINSMLWGESKAKTARMMLERAGVFKREHYSKRMQELLEQSHKEVPANQNYAMEALNAALRDCPEYVSRQFNPRVIKMKNTCSERFNPAWTLSDIEKWITASVTYIRMGIEHDEERFGHVVQG